MDITERFLKYVAFDTTSDDSSDTCPSTAKQLNLARFLRDEMLALGLSDVVLDENGYVYGRIPATTAKKIPAVGFIAHMDTVIDCPGCNIKTRFVENYDGGDVVLNPEKNIVMTVKEFPYLPMYRGETLIVTDGTTLLGSDDKAGVAEIMTMAEYFLTHPEIEHGPICVAFTPDEEIGRGADRFDLKQFAADVGYTVDGGRWGEIGFENFNAASLIVKVHGKNIHPGDSKNKMVNSILIAMEYESLLPAAEKPMYTELREGFFHLNDIRGNVELTELNYIIRDHDKAKFLRKKELAAQAGAFLNQKYGEGTVEVILKDSYYNMLEKIEPHMYLIDIAEQAIRAEGGEPFHTACRGGTDGARLSFEGLPCPNLCAGGNNIHGRMEFVTVESLQHISKMLIHVCELFAQRAW